MGLLFGGSTTILILGLISLACLVIACITPPALSSFGLAFAENIMYGTLGYCNISTNKCNIGKPFYTVTDLTNLNDWKMDDNARNTLAKILIIIPIGAFFTLINVFFNFLGHFNRIGKSSVFNIFRFIVSLLAFFASAIGCIVVFLLFYPHVKWPSWLLIPAAALNLVNIPLSFFVLRVNTDSDDDDDDGFFGEKFEPDLTDLTINDHFKSDNSTFNFVKTPSYSVTNSSQRDFVQSEQFKAPNMANRTGGGELYQRSSLDHNSVNSNHNQLTAHSVINDGTPTIVSSQNYGKVNNVAISQAPLFQAKAITADFSNNSTGEGSTFNYENSQRIVQPDNNRTPQSDIIAVQLKPSSQLNPNSSQQQNRYVSGPLNSDGRIPNSIINEYDFENPDMNNDDDADSNFTSISQRPANPIYYNRSYNKGPSLLEQAQYYNLPPSTQYQQIPSSNTRVKDSSEMVLNYNPDFSINGPAFQNNKNIRRPNQNSSGGYKPAYKRTQPSASQMGPASGLSDSPYNIKPIS